MRTLCCDVLVPPYVIMTNGLGAIIIRLSSERTLQALLSVIKSNSQCNWPSFQSHLTYQLSPRDTSRSVAELLSFHDEKYSH